MQEFVQKYKARYGVVPDGLAALGYDAALVLFDAMDRAKSLDGADLAAAIAATKDFPGVTGKITLDAQRNPVKSAVILQIKCGAPHYVATIVPPGQPESTLPPPPEVACTKTPRPRRHHPRIARLFAKLLQTLVNTLALGALYALIALGYTLVYGVLRFINFAHSDVFTFGAWSRSRWRRGSAGPRRRRSTRCPRS